MPTDSLWQLELEGFLRYTSHPRHSPIWQILRATTATPTYFAPIQLTGEIEGAEYFDAIYAVPNPFPEGYRQIRAESGKDPGVVVSIGLVQVLT